MSIFRTDTNLDGAAAFSIRVLIGNRGDEMLMLCARHLAQAVLESGCTRYADVILLCARYGMLLLTLLRHSEESLALVLHACCAQRKRHA